MDKFELPFEFIDLFSYLCWKLWGYQSRDCRKLRVDSIMHMPSLVQCVLSGCCPSLWVMHEAS